MGTLRSRPDGRLVPLRPFHRVGRSAGADLALLEASGASREHAVLVWEDAGWKVRDLGSRNGTWVDGVCLPRGAEQALVAGARLGFGSPDGPWELASDAAPTAFATSGSDLAVATEDGLFLPSPEEARCVVRQDRGGRWVRDEGGGVLPVHDGERLVIDGCAWTLHVPSVLPPTRSPEAEGIPPSTRAELLVAEDHVHVLLRGAFGELDLGVRAHHRLLLVFARERLRAARRGEDEADAGWVHTEDLAAHLGITPNAAYVQLHRLRRQLAECGWAAAPALVERRFTGELRLARVDVHVAGA